MQASQKVYKIVRTIPAGKVTTYGNLARACGIRSARAVGQILHRNNDTATPCHRVVFADGSLSESYAFGGAEEQKMKLVSEGVKFAGDKVDLKASLVTNSKLIQLGE